MGIIPAEGFECFDDDSEANSEQVTARRRKPIITFLNCCNAVSRRRNKKSPYLLHSRSPSKKSKNLEVDEEDDPEVIKMLDLFNSKKFKEASVSDIPMHIILEGGG